MPKLRINKFAGLSTANGSTQPVATFPPKSTSQALSFSTSTQSDAAAVREFWEIVSDTDCYFEVGADPTATTDSTLLLAGVYYPFQIAQGMKLAVVAK